MKEDIPEYVERALRELKLAVQRDSFNLTRDDHDAVCAQVDLLEDFIRGRYRTHGGGRG